MTVGMSRMSTPPVMIWASPSAIPSEPRVTISGGILALAISVPFSSPQSSPISTETTMPRNAVPQPSPPVACITLAATTPEKTITEPIDRSMPEVTITKVMPTPSTARIEAFCAIRRALPMLAKLIGASVANTAMITINTSRIWKACMCTSRDQSDSLLWSSAVAPPAGASVWMVMPPPSRSPRSWRPPAPPWTCPWSGTWPLGARAAAPAPGPTPRSRAASSG